MSQNGTILLERVIEVKIRSLGWALYNITGVFTRRHKHTQREDQVKTEKRREKTAICQSRREALDETKSADTLFLAF